MADYQPMIALNVYLESYFRQEILRKVLTNRDKLPETLQSDLVTQIKSEVKVSGFRNSLTAPAGLLVRSAEKVFEKNSRFLKTILECWAATFTADLGWMRNQLKSLGFTPTDVAEVYSNPENAFLTGWPEGVTYSKLEHELKSRKPELDLSKNDLSLLTIWLSGYLPGANASTEG